MMTNTIKITLLKENRIANVMYLSSPLESVVDNNFQKESNLTRYVYPNFHSILFCFLNFQNFWLNESTVFGFSKRPSGKISVPFTPVPKFLKFLVEWKVPRPCVICNLRVSMKVPVVVFTDMYKQYRHTSNFNSEFEIFAHVSSCHKMILKMHKQ